ncbi:hypothetical protein RI103_06030 [Paraburkholderia sp. FT54]|uniref:hypothetical protein n=1 Tax=Paraburkholderia sp. FT54 TaxID=3074437 RepID=UPI0028777659|nr:hypothetical protein [Paraburkholderia sp. FT54]WNC90905.1 hypothetical protein RI103_06030 [Paraburkholderia sp. FT54]
MKFQYTRKRGEKRTYDVTLVMTNKIDTGGFAYVAMVYRGDDFLGQLTRWPLQAKTMNDATEEARQLVQRDIEDLVGIDE